MSNALPKKAHTSQIQYKDVVDTYITSKLKQYQIPSPLNDAVAYSLLAGGKRLRPSVCLSFCSDLGDNPELLIPGAAALEFLHAASLVHDDLPALDNDQTRRGKPTCHIAFNEATALLCGDILPSIAFSAIKDLEINSEQKLAAVEILSTAYFELCCGQQLDILPREDEADLAILCRLKTGALFSAALQIGSLLFEKGDPEREQIKELGYLIGHLYQITDDFLDVFSSKQTLGREESSDVKNQRTTYFSTGNELKEDNSFYALHRKILNTLSALETRFELNKGFLNTRAIIDSIVSRIELKSV